MRALFKNFYVQLVIRLSCMAVAASNLYAGQSVLYGGGPLYTDAAVNREMIRNSGFTTLVIWTIHVQPDGDLVLNNHKIVDDGVYVGRSEWPAEVAAFKSGQTSVSRIELGLSGHQSDTFLNIRDLVFSQGTGPDGRLYQNFQLLRELIPSVDGINFDEESHIYDTNVPYTMKQFSLMLADLGFHIELDVFCCSEVWTDIFNFVNGERPGTIDRIDLQCYAGGGGNDPCWWNARFGGLKVTPGLWAYPASESGGFWSRNPSQVESQMDTWNSSCNIAGGFMWYLDDMLLALDEYAVADYGNAINSALGIDPSRKIAATVYQHGHYWGWSVEVGEGPYGELEIAAAGGQIDDISSIQVRPGWKVTFYSEANFHGNSLVKTADDPTLDDDGWNDAVKSMTISRIREPLVTLYQHTDYWGWSADFLETGDYTADDIAVAGGLDNDASSLEVAPGYIAVFYEKDLFQGNTLIKTADDSTLVDDEWNDVVSSMKIRRDPTQITPLTLYQDCDYWGGWSADFDVGTYTLAQMAAAGALNDDASSLKIETGYTVTLYEHDHFQGESITLTADEFCLFDDGWNDRVSSLMIEGPFAPPGPYWQCNENTGSILNDSYGLFDGQLKNMTQEAWTQGKNCGALSFDGVNDYVEVNNYRGVTGGLSRTCAVWVKTSAVKGDILSWGLARSGGRWLLTLSETGSLQLAVYNGYRKGSIRINDGRWHHLAVVFENDGSPDTGDVKLYVDGAEDTAGDTLPQTIDTAPDGIVRLGIFPDSQNRYFEGRMDETRIFNRALAPTEIRTLFEMHALTADTRRDGRVNYQDFGQLAAVWENGSPRDGDLTCDGVVGFDDLMILIDEWLMQLP